MSMRAHIQQVIEWAQARARGGGLDGFETAAHALAEYAERMEKAFERVLIGGNHLAIYKTARWPAPETNPLDALRLLCATQEYDMWCCWREIMLARTFLAQAGEARRAETPLGGSVHEHAAAEGRAP